jgi:hypothetical protein
LIIIFVLRYTKALTMTSKKLDLLEQLKRDEERLKLRQKELAEEIELDIHRQNLLEQSGTIIKLKTQLDLFKNKIMEEEIAPNNYELLICNKVNELGTERMGRRLLQEFRHGLGEKTLRDKITIKEYFDNITCCSDKTIEDINNLQEIRNQSGPRVRGPLGLHQYYDSIDPIKAKKLISDYFPGRSAYEMLPILTTIMGVLDKQQKSIETINKRLDTVSI